MTVLGLTLKSYGPPPPIAFRSPVWEYMNMVQVEALIKYP